MTTNYAPSRKACLPSGPPGSCRFGFPDFLRSLEVPSLIEHREFGFDKEVGGRARDNCAAKLLVGAKLVEQREHLDPRAPYQQISGRLDALVGPVDGPDSGAETTSAETTSAETA